MNCDCCISLNVHWIPNIILFVMNTFCSWILLSCQSVFCSWFLSSTAFLRPQKLEVSSGYNLSSCCDECKWCMFTCMAFYKACCSTSCAGFYQTVHGVAVLHPWFLLFQSLLDEPNPNSPANNVAAQLYRDSRREYENRVATIVEESWVNNC